MKVTAFNNGDHLKSGGGYGIRIPIEYRAVFFNSQWKKIRLTLEGDLTFDVNISESFWSTCPELRSIEIGKWMILRGHRYWPLRNPPKFKLIKIGDASFKLESHKTNVL